MLPNYDTNPRTIFSQEKETGRYVQYALKTSNIFITKVADRSSIEAQAKEPRRKYYLSQ